MAKETTRPLKVFLCHASGDKPAVRDLYKRLITEGVDAWLDQEKLLPGQNWRVEIPRAVREADVVVICLSNKSITKEGYIQKEIKFALDSADEKPEGAIFLIPARLEDCVVPEQLSRWQWVDLHEENGFVKLLHSLKLRADKVGATIEPLPYRDEDKEIESRVDQLYTEGLAAFWVEDWDRACQRFQTILREQPSHKNAAEKLAEAERQRNLVKLYAQATAAYKSEDWQTAIKALEELLGKSGDYKDTVQLLKDAKKQRQLRELYTEAKRLHAAQKWQAVIRVFDQIAGIDSVYPDPDGLLPSAQQEAAELKRLADLNILYSQGVHKMDAGEWYEARGLLEQVHKAQTGFLDTERLLRKIEHEILRIEEGRKRNAQVQTLYEQARKMTRAGQWSKALAQMEEIHKLDNQFVDSDGLMERSKAELEREEQEAQQRRELAALYAEAVSLLEAKKYQEALEKWNAIQAIDPKYKDSFGVKKTARRKLDELSRPEAVGRRRLKIISDWIRLEANIPADREVLTEKLLLLSFAAVAIIVTLYYPLQELLHISESSLVARFLTYSFLGGLYGTVVAFALNKTIYNWSLKQSYAVIVGWALAQSIPWIVRQYINVDFTTIYALIAGISTAVAIKWAKPDTHLIDLILIFTGWILAWKGGGTLGVHLLSVFGTGYIWAIADPLAILLGLLFTFGMQVEGSWMVLRTALFGALGFAIGNYIDDRFIVLSSLPMEFAVPISITLWGLIGGAILEAPSRNARQILFTAGICGIGLLAGYYTALVAIPAFAGQPYLATFPEQYHVIRNAIWGLGLGLAFGSLVRRASAIGVLGVLGAGIYMVTHVLYIGFLDISSVWGAILRGALIGLVLGYGYGYMRKAEPLQSKPRLVTTKPVWIGIVGSLIIILTIIVFRNPTMYDDFNNPLYNGKFNIALWNYEGDTSSGEIIQENGSLTLGANGYNHLVALNSSQSYKPTYPMFVESEVMLDPATAKGAVISIGFVASDGYSLCGIWAGLAGIDTQTISCWSVYFGVAQTDYDVRITPGTWHLLRIELYPDTMTFAYVVDGKEVGSYVPRNPDKLKNLSYSHSLQLWTGELSAPSATGYVDYVRSGLSSYLWDFDNSTQGWGDDLCCNISIPEAMNGSLTFKSTGADPYIHSPVSLHISAAATPVITVRMRIINGQGSFGSILFLTNQNSDWGAAPSVSFPITNDGTFHSYNILMSKSPAWQGVITQLRLDPIEDGAVNAQIEVDYISVHAP